MSGTEPCPGSPVHKRSTVTRAPREGSWMNLKQFHHNSTLASKRRGLRSSANHFFLKLGRFCPFSKATSGLYLPAGLSPGVFRLWCPLHLHIEEGQIASPFCFWNMDIVWYLFWLPPLVAFLLSPLLEKQLIACCFPCLFAILLGLKLAILLVTSLAVCTTYKIDSKANLTVRTETYLKQTVSQITFTSKITSKSSCYCSAKELVLWP